jgi:hypothetical protein
MFNYLAPQLYVQDIAVLRSRPGDSTASIEVFRDFSQFIQESATNNAVSTSICSLEIAELGVEQISLIC